MTEVDWDKIIKAAKSKKKEQKQSNNIEKRLDRMEKLLKKSMNSEDDKYKDIVPRNEERERLKNAGFKFVKVKKKKTLPSMPNVRMPKIKNILSDKRIIAVIGIIAVFGAFGGLYLTGNLPSFDGLFVGNSSSESTMYVCPDGITTVSNITLCPTTTTTSTTSTTTTTTVPTTTTTLGASHSIAISDGSCDGIISLTLTNTGTTSDNTAYVTFYVDGELETGFYCAGGALAPGESTSCYSSIMEDGTHEVEARGLVNTDTLTVNC